MTHCHSYKGKSLFVDLQRPREKKILLSHQENTPGRVDSMRIEKKSSMSSRGECRDRKSIGEGWSQWLCLSMKNLNVVSNEMDRQWGISPEQTKKWSNASWLQSKITSDFKYSEELGRHSSSISEDWLQKRERVMHRKTRQSREYCDLVRTRGEGIKSNEFNRSWNKMRKKRRFSRLKRRFDHIDGILKRFVSIFVRSQLKI